MTLIAAQRAMLLSNAYLRRHTRYQQNKIILNCIRAFSKYDIVEVQDAQQNKAQEATSQQPPKVESAATKPQPTLSPSQKRSVEEIAQKLIFAEHSSQMELDDARRLLLRTCAEAQSLLSFDKDEAISSEEIVATADYFLILINDEDIDNSIAKIQALQGDLEDEQSLLGDGELLRVVAAMNQLHCVFIAMVDTCIPPMLSSLQNSDNESSNNNIDDVENSISYDKEKYSSKTVARALQISRRAEDLGMPLHRPLYKRLAMSVAVTSLGHLDDDAQDDIAKEITPLELPGQFQQIKEGFAPSPIAMELIDLCIRVRVALKIPSPILSIGRDPLEEFAAEILSDPLLLLLKREQWEEAMSLLEGWREHFGRSEKINLLTMLGEHTTLEALEIAKSWVVKEEFVQDAQASHHALHLTSLLEESLETILDERKRRAAKLSRILPHLIGQLESTPSDEEEFDSDGSDSEYEEEFDSDEDDDWEQSDASVDADDTTTMEYKVNADDDEEDVMIAGMSNMDVRSRIYLRNSCDWSIPDVVGQLENWNKGRALSFSPAFERYLCQQMMIKEDDEFFD